MPTYEYRCPEGHEFEHFYRTMAGAEAELPCPVCGKTAQRKVSGGAGLVFKGSGFYITDYGKDGKKDLRRGGTGRSSGGADGGGSTGSEKSSAGSGDSNSSSPGSEKEKKNEAKKPDE